jgi:malate dehydrogenase (oxaloacetate-decarboxylating)
MDYDKESLAMHKRLKGKISTKLDFDIKTKDDLSIAYTPGIAAVSLKVFEEPSSLREYTSAGKTVAIISNGTAVLGLGDIGARASYPVMEGKAALFKHFGGVDAMPLVVDIKDVDEFISFVEKVSINFAGINLEDIKAPECFVIENKLKEKLDIPVFHDDQHGTAIVVSAALKNALKLANKKIEDVKIVISGAGSAGIAIAKILRAQGVNKLFLIDSKGLVVSSRTYLEVEDEKKAFAINEKEMNLEEALIGSDVFIGVSKPGVLKKEFISSMNEKPIIFGLSNPIPEIMPNEAFEGGAFIVATGRSDFPNQINNVLAFPGLFRGALDAKAKSITEDMKLAAVDAIANFQEPKMDELIPNSLNKDIHLVVAKAVENASKLKQ